MEILYLSYHEADPYTPYITRPLTEKVFICRSVLKDGTLKYLKYKACDLSHCSNLTKDSGVGLVIPLKL